MIDVYKALEIAADNSWTIEFSSAQRIATVIESQAILGQARWGRTLPDTSPVSAMISAVEKAAEKPGPV